VSYAAGRARVFASNGNKPTPVEVGSRSVAAELSSRPPPVLFQRQAGIGRQPFLPSRFDNLELEIRLLANNQLGITFTLRSWGNAQFAIQVLGCDAGVGYGVGAVIGAAIPDALYAIWVGRIRAGGFL
jgi:hypothetical protein